MRVRSHAARGRATSASPRSKRANRSRAGSKALILAALPFLVPLLFGTIIVRRESRPVDPPGARSLARTSERPSEPPPAVDPSALLRPEPEARHTIPAGVAAPRTAPSSPPAAQDSLPRRTDARLEIRVHESGSGRALPHAQIELNLTSRTGDRATIELLSSDARGRAELATDAERARIVAWANGFAGGPLEVDLDGGRTTRVDIDCQATFAIAGRVTEAETGMPVPGASVFFWTFSESDRALSGPDGAFWHPRFPATGCAEQIRVEAPGFGAAVRYLRIAQDGAWEFPGARAETGTRSGHGTPWIEIELPRALVIQGSVQDEAGRPIAGALVSAEGFYRALPTVASRDGAEAFCDGDGSFTLENLRGDIGHSLLIRSSGFAERVLEVERRSGLLDLGAIALSGESVLAGVIIDPDGFPAEDLALVLLPLEESDPLDPALGEGDLAVDVRVQGIERRTRTSPEGTFVFEHLTDRPYQLSVARDREPLLEREIRPEQPSGFASVELELPREARTLVGQALPAAGLVDASFELVRFGRVGRFTFAADGTFRAAGLDDLAPYEFRAQALCPLTGRTLQARGTVWAFERLVVAFEAREEGSDPAGLAPLASK